MDATRQGRYLNGKRSSHVEADVRRKQGRKLSKLEKRVISLAGNPNSCLIKIQKQKYRALIDSGAEVSLINRKIYDSLKSNQS